LLERFLIARPVPIFSGSAPVLKEKSMPIVSVIYPRGDGATFDFNYYERTHLPLVVSLWAEAGLTGAEALRGTAAADGSEASFVAIALLRFASMDAFRAAMGGPHAAEIIGDVANFTNIQPVIQINEPIGKGK
jgi:uncharacterized protein (TIGR02118 family)